MAEYIEREAARNALYEADAITMKGVRIINQFPSADVVEVRHGEWVHSDMAAHWYGKDKCSNCHYRTYDGLDLTHFNYCPNCGAKMDGKGDGDG